MDDIDKARAMLEALTKIEDNAVKNCRYNRRAADAYVEQLKAHLETSANIMDLQRLKIEKLRRAGQNLRDCPHPDDYDDWDEASRKEEWE